MYCQVACLICAQLGSCPQIVSEPPVRGIDRCTLKKGRSPQGWAGVCLWCGDVDFQILFCGILSAWAVGRLAGWLFGFLRTLVASASPRSLIVCNRFWDLSRRERCLDKSQNLLRAAWIGVMQKNWIPQELPRRCGIATWWGATQRVESPLQFVQRVALW